MASEEEKYFQFFPEKDLPIFVRLLDQAPLNSISDVLEQCHFKKISKDVFEKYELKSMGYRVLKITQAGPRAYQQIENSMESDLYGPESMAPNGGYSVYRYKHMALMIHSLMFQEWEIGVSDLFFEESHTHEVKVIINRYLAQALAPHGLIGFWGSLVGPQLLVQKCLECSGESFFIDINNAQVLVSKGESENLAKLSFLRIDLTCVESRKKMTQEELLAFLSSRTTFFGQQGLILPIRQMLQVISKQFSGFVSAKMHDGNSGLSIS